MELILKNFNMKGTVEAILDSMEDHDEMRTLKTFVDDALGCDCFALAEGSAI